MLFRSIPSEHSVLLLARWTTSQACRPQLLHKPRSLFEFRRFSPSLLALLCLFTVVDVQAAEPTVRANDELLRQQERERARREQQEKKPDVRFDIAADPESALRLPYQEAPCFIIRRIKLIGDAADEFQWAIEAANKPQDPAFVRCLGATGIKIAMKRVQNAIIERGFVTTRVLAQPQDLKTGTLTLTLVPGRIRAIKITDVSDKRVRLSNALPASPGDLLNLRDIEQALENLKRVPTADAKIDIAPAEGNDAKPGESDLLISWRQGRFYRANLSLDDSGSEATGTYQANTTLSLDNPLSFNDLFYISYNRALGGGLPGDRGSKAHTLHYSIPYDYWQLAATRSESRFFQSVVGATQTYLYRGNSEDSELQLSRLIYRDATRKLTVNTSGWARSSNNFIDDTEVEVQRRRMAGWELGLTLREFIGSSTLDLNLDYRRGTGAFDGLAAPEEAFGEGTARASRYMASAQFQLPFEFLGQQWRYSPSARWQWNRTPLVPQDRFSIGGRYSVRGFDGENILSAERGWFLRNDLNLALGESGQQLYLGLDYGQVSGASSEQLAGQHLTGSVIGIQGAISVVSYELFWGTPIDKPDRFETDNSNFGFNLNFSY